MYALPPDESPVFLVVPTFLSKKVSILDAAGVVSNLNLSISILKNRNLRSSSSQRLTYVTYRRWNGVKSGFNYTRLFHFVFVMFVKGGKGRHEKSEETEECEMR